MEDGMESNFTQEQGDNARRMAAGRDRYDSLARGQDTTKGVVTRLV
jgi:hypothetical protein